MAINNVRTALQLLSGAGEVTRAKALEAAGTLLELPGVGETSARASQLAEELIDAAAANQAMVSELVRTEVDGRLAALGLARSSDLSSAQRKIEALEREVAQLREKVAAGDGAAAAASAGSGSTSRSVSKRSAGTKNTKTTTAKRAAKKTSATKAATKAPAKTAAKKTTVKKTTPAKKAATKSTAKSTSKTAAKKTSSRTS
ncbi:hypothetical protein [Flexivirga sp. B27]